MNNYLNIIFHILTAEGGVLRSIGDMGNVMTSLTLGTITANTLTTTTTTTTTTSSSSNTVEAQSNTPATTASTDNIKTANAKNSAVSGKNPASNKGKPQPTQSQSNQHLMKEYPLVMDTKLKIIEILQFILDVRLDYRISCLLSLFKNEFDTVNHNLSEKNFKLINLETICRQAEDIFCFNNDSINNLDLDGQCGRMFLRVLLHLIMHNYPSLVSGALHLLFRHFSQRQEVLNAFKQVQLLVSDSDIESYKQIKTDLDILRQSVEKSELWVYKSTKQQQDDTTPVLPTMQLIPTDGGINPTTDNNSVIKMSDIIENEEGGNASNIDHFSAQNDDMLLNHEQQLEYSKIKDILIRMNNLCIQNFQPRKHEQRLLRNVGVHTVILDLLQIPYDEKDDYKMIELMLLAHKFLQNFCLANHSNQVLLHKYLDLFLNPSIIEAETICSIFKDNLALCNEIQIKVIQHFIHCIEINGKHVEYLKFLQTIVKSENQYIRKCQDLVMQELINAGDDVLIFYNDKTSFNLFINIMNKSDTDEEAHQLLNYHIELVKLLACCTMGKNVYTEIKCNSLLSLDDIVSMLCHPACLISVKIAYVNFLNHCYIDTEVEMKEIYSSNHMWMLFENSFINDIEKLLSFYSITECEDLKQQELLNYIINEIMTILMTFFNSPFSDQTTQIKQRQLIFVQLLQKIHKLSQVKYLQQTSHYYQIINCLRTLNDVAKLRCIVMPTDLEHHLAILFNKTSILTKQTSKWLITAKQSINNNGGGNGNSSGGYNQGNQNSSQNRDDMNESQLMYLDRCIIEGLQDIVTLLDEQLKPLVSAELSILVDILYHSELLFNSNTESYFKCKNGGFIKRLIKHTVILLEEKEEQLCVKVLRILREMMAVDLDYGDKGDFLRSILLKRYFSNYNMLAPPPSFSLSGQQNAGQGLIQNDEDHNDSKYLQRAGCTLYQIQLHLDKKGASNLVIELVIKSVNSPTIFEEAIQLGIALLEGGNSIIQKSMFIKFQINEISQSFFKVFYDKMRDAQQEIKSTVTVNTTEIAAKANETNNLFKDIEKFKLNSGGVGVGSSGMSNIAISSKKFINSSNSGFGALGGGNNIVTNVGIHLTEELKDELNQAGIETQRAYNNSKTTTSIINQQQQHQQQQQTQQLHHTSHASHHLDEYDRVSSTTLSTTAETSGALASITINKLTNKISVMQPILRFLQLLCENHNSDLQNLLRSQNSKTNFNLVSETLMFLDCICGSTTGGLGLLGLYINENNVQLINQTLETLTEYCQGPCHENQNCIAIHESNGLDIITALILNDINPLGKNRIDLVLELKNNASKLLLAIMESRGDSENAERILYNMNPKQLIDVACHAYHQDDLIDNFKLIHSTNDILLIDSTSLSSLTTSTNTLGSVSASGVDGPTDTENGTAGGDIIIDEDSQGGCNSGNGTYDDDDENVNGVSPKEVGHNIYILCHQLAQHNKELSQLLKIQSHQDEKTKVALNYYATHTAQIEIVRHDRTLEQIVFPIPEICEYLTRDTKLRILNTAERDDQGSKVTDFFERHIDMFNEMKWQKKLRSQICLFWVSSYMSLWSNILFYCAVLINLIVAFFYPFDNSVPGSYSQNFTILITVNIYLFLFQNLIFICHRSYGLL